MKNLNSQRGFILLVTIMACAILAALGILVFSLSTGDLRASVSTLGEKRALVALDSGWHATTQNFDPLVANYGINLNAWVNIDTANDPGSRYKITACLAGSQSPLPLPGYSMEESQGWRMQRFDMTIVGENTRYRTNLEMDVGVAYGPIDISLFYR